MCAVSMVGDHYRDLWKEKDWWSPIQPWTPGPGQTIPAPQITRAEFDELRRQVEEMKELLKRAKKYDEDNNEPHCEIEEKMNLLRRIAKLVGVDINDVIGEKNV